ncbi:hypothetical protein BB559_003444 [Furculomyces boomerangus]|uniref:Arrestin-like N-terminal domain-containing protein n=2 Tax=Harpellales TaxID=61421 RepID=A0A2T9YL65_9FUNG|nr:hypothetical protein BB559_003444 [Furculomyces boomerangus]PWA03653.1 hypothetical protein BB558_000190 [Smittium angustum]
MKKTKRAHKIQLDILPDNQHILLRGTPDESSGFVIGGYVRLKNSSPVSIKSLHLNLVNKYKTNWITEPSDACVIHNTTSKQVLHTRKLFKCMDSSHIFNPGTHLFSFSMPLPGDTLESIYHENLENGYYLEAKIKRPGLSKNIYLKRKIEIERDVLSDGLLNSTEISISRTWKDILDVSVYVPSNVFTKSSKIEPIITFEPKVNDLKITSIGVSLWETARFYSVNNEKYSKRYTRMISKSSRCLEPLPLYSNIDINSNTSSILDHFYNTNTQTTNSYDYESTLQSKRSEKYKLSNINKKGFYKMILKFAHNFKNYINTPPIQIPLKDYNSGTELKIGEQTSDYISLFIPSNPGSIEFDSQNDMVKISHRLRFAINIKTGNNTHSYIWISSPVYIIPTGPEDQKSSEQLPLYGISHLDVHIQDGYSTTQTSI